MNAKRFLLTIIGLIIIACAHAQYNIQCEDTCNHVHGIDMSHYQGDIWWSAVGENNRINYCYLKASEGGTNVDHRYLENIEMARRYNVLVGSYHFYRPRQPQEEQLRNFRSQCRPQDQDLIPMIDVEATGGLNSDELCDSLKLFLQLVEREYHCKPLIYSGQSFYNRHLAGQFSGYLFMIAKYSPFEPQLIDGKDIYAWQYTGKGHLNGVNGYVDKSRLMGRHSLREISYRRNRRR
jgi:lysozyme